MRNKIMRNKINNLYSALSLLNKEQKEIAFDVLAYNLQSANDYVVKFDANGKPIHPAKTEGNWNLEMKKLYDIEYNKWRKS